MIEESSQTLDYTDFQQTDFPSDVPIPNRLYLQDDPEEHDGIKEWVLTVSMDQGVEQVSTYSIFFYSIFINVLLKYFYLKHILKSFYICDLVVINISIKIFVFLLSPFLHALKGIGLFFHLFLQLFSIPHHYFQFFQLSLSSS